MGSSSTAKNIGLKWPVRFIGLLAVSANSWGMAVLLANKSSLGSESMITSWIWSASTSADTSSTLNIIASAPSGLVDAMFPLGSGSSVSAAAVLRWRFCNCPVKLESPSPTSSSSLQLTSSNADWLNCSSLTLICSSSWSLLWPRKHFQLCGWFQQDGWIQANT